MYLGVAVAGWRLHLSDMIMDEHYRQAAILAAENVSSVRLAHDHLYFFDATSGFGFTRPKMRNGQELVSCPRAGGLYMHGNVKRDKKMPDGTKRQ